MAEYKEIRGTKIQNFTTDPPTTLEGQVWYDETARAVQYNIQNLTSAGAWRTGGNLNSGRWYTTGTGTESDMLLVGGEKSGSPAYVG